MKYTNNKNPWTITNPKNNKKNINNKYNKLLWITIFIVTIISIISGIYLPIFNNNHIIVIFRISMLALIFTSITFTKEGNEFYKFLISSKIELSKIIWPNKKEIINLTIIILITIIITSILIYFIGMVFIYIIKNILNY